MDINKYKIERNNINKELLNKIEENEKLIKRSIDIEDKIKSINEKNIRIINIVK